MTSFLEALDPQTGQWTTGGPMPTKRGGGNGIAANGYSSMFCLWWGETPSSPGILAGNDVGTRLESRPTLKFTGGIQSLM
jgi:hypothetical protein